MLLLSKRLLGALIMLNAVVVILFAVMLALLLSPLAGTASATLRAMVDPAEAAVLLRAFAWLMALGIAAGVAAHLAFRRMRAIVATAIAGDPFTIDNAHRLRMIGWALLVLQFLDLGFGIIAWVVESGTDERLGWAPSVGGWIAVLMVFVLARVFEQGARMRDELAMTV